jgi:hypothetical protein
VGAQNTVLLDFGAAPGAQEATVDVTGQAGFVSTSLCEAWILPVATVDHSADEHRHEEIDVKAAYLADGTIRVYGRCTANGAGGATRHKLYGKFNVGWVWN